MLGLYETMGRISAQMVEAARANNWERLVALERDVVGLRRKLEAGDIQAPLTAEERARKIALIRRILADDAEVRCQTEPWMEQVRKFLGNGARGRNVRHAYGSGTGQ